MFTLLIVIFVVVVLWYWLHGLVYLLGIGIGLIIEASKWIGAKIKNKINCRRAK